MRGSIILAIGLGTAAALEAQSPAPQGPSPVKGTAILMGQAVDAKGAGVPGAMVLLDGGLQPIGSSIVAAPLPGDPRRSATSADGHFVFFDLPGGVYSLEAAKPGFLSGAYGRKRYGGGAQSIKLAEGERLTSIRFQMWEYAAIAGRIQDEAGEPLVGIKVRALPRVLEAGRWRLDATVNAALADETDDRGDYRIDGLPPGDYVVVVPSTQTTMPGVLPAPPPPPPGLLQTPAAATAVAQIGGQALFRTVDDWLLLTGRRGEPTMPPPSGGDIFVYPTTFYPGARSTTDASVVTLGSGDERLGVNVQLAPVRTTTVSGAVTSPGAVVPGQSVRLQPDYVGELTTDTGFEVALATTDREGHFVFLGVPPGQYQLRNTTAVTSGEASARRVYSAAMPLAVGSAGVSDVVLTMRGGVRVSGRIAFDGTLPKPGPEALQRFAIRLDPAEPFVHRSQTAYRAAVDAAGSFQIIDVPSGKYVVKFQASAQDRRAMEGWESAGALLGGRDVSTRPMDVQSDTAGIVLTLSDHAGRLTGVARDASGRMDPDACVLLFTTERDLWMDAGSTNRRIRAARAGEDGTFVFPVVHSGTYFLTAIPEADAANWDDPRTMEKIALTATRVQFGDNERKTQDVTTRPVR